MHASTQEQSLKVRELDLAQRGEVVTRLQHSLEQRVLEFEELMQWRLMASEATEGTPLQARLAEQLSGGSGSASGDEAVAGGNDTATSAGATTQVDPTPAVEGTNGTPVVSSELPVEEETAAKENSKGGNASRADAGETAGGDQQPKDNATTAAAETVVPVTANTTVPTTAPSTVPTTTTATGTTTTTPAVTAASTATTTSTTPTTAIASPTSNPHTEPAAAEASATEEDTNADVNASGSGEVAQHLDLISEELQEMRAELARMQAQQPSPRAAPQPPAPQEVRADLLTFWLCAAIVAF